MRPAPAPSARSSSLVNLLLPCTMIIAGSTPACSATSSSPPVHTPTPRPSSAAQRSTPRLQNAAAA